MQLPAAPAPPAESVSPAAKARVYEQGLLAVVGALERAHVPVLVVHPVPVVKRGWDVRGCAVVRELAHDCGVSAARSAVED